MKFYENLETIIQLSKSRNNVLRDAWDKGPGVFFLSTDFFKPIK